MENEVRERVGINDSWDVDIDVKPYLGVDWGYKIDYENKIIKIKVYSARFPQTWYQWKDEGIEAIKRGMENLDKEGEISDWKG